MGTPGIPSRKGPDSERQLQARTDRSAVLALIRQAGPLSAAEIARLSGRTPTQVRRRTEELSDLGEIEARGGRWAAVVAGPEARRA